MYSELHYHNTKPPQSLYFLGVFHTKPPLKSKNICTSFPLQPTKNNEQQKILISPLSFHTSFTSKMYCDVQSCHPFKTHYVRNNRRSTEKNLRCFPCCNKDGHVSQGFCGRGMKQKVILTKACLGKYSKRRSSSCNSRSNSFH